MIKALFKFDRNIPKDAMVVDTTNNTSPIWKWISPFILPAPPAKNLENLWQFSKVYKHHIGSDGLPNEEWYKWRIAGFADPKAHRYPMGKGRKPEYSFWNGEKLGYISARKEIYIPEYIKNVVSTGSFKLLAETYTACQNHGKLLVLLDYDAYDHQALGMSLKDVVNNPDRIMGHSFVLLGLLTGEPLV